MRIIKYNFLNLKKKQCALFQPKRKAIKKRKKNWLPLVGGERASQCLSGVLSYSITNGEPTFGLTSSDLPLSHQFSL